MTRPTTLVRHRGGYTLVEMLVVITIFSFLLATVSVALATLWRTQQDLQTELQQSAGVARVARQLRADGHLAQSAVLRPPAANEIQVLRLSGVGQYVEYTLETERIVRTVYAADQLTHREVYPLTSMDVTFTDEDDSSPLLSVTVGSSEQRAPNSAIPPRTMQIEVAIGLLSGVKP